MTDQSRVHYQTIFVTFVIFEPRGVSPGQKIIINNNNNNNKTIIYKAQ